MELLRWIENPINQSVFKAEVIMTLNEFYVKVKYQNKIFSCRPQLPTEILKIKSDCECGGCVHKFHILVRTKPKEHFPLLVIISLSHTREKVFILNLKISPPASVLRCLPLNQFQPWTFLETGWWHLNKIASFRWNYVRLP